MWWAELASMATPADCQRFVTAITALPCSHGLYSAGVMYEITVCKTENFSGASGRCSRIARSSRSTDLPPLSSRSESSQGAGCLRKQAGEYPFRLD